MNAMSYQHCGLGRAVQCCESSAEVACDAQRWQPPENESPFVDRYVREHRSASRHVAAAKGRWCLAASAGAWRRAVLVAVLLISLAGLSRVLPHTNQPLDQEHHASKAVAATPTPVSSAPSFEEQPASYRPLKWCLEYLRSDDFNGARAAIADSGLSVHDEDDLLAFVTDMQQRYADRVARLTDDVAHLLELRRFQEASQRVQVAMQLCLGDEQFLQELTEAVEQAKSYDPGCLQTIGDLNDYRLSCEQRAELQLRLSKSVGQAWTNARWLPEEPAKSGQIETNGPPRPLAGTTF